MTRTANAISRSSMSNCLPAAIFHSFEIGHFLLDIGYSVLGLHVYVLSMVRSARIPVSRPATASIPRIPRINRPASMPTPIERKPCCTRSCRSSGPFATTPTCLPACRGRPTPGDDPPAGAEVECPFDRPAVQFGEANQGHGLAAHCGPQMLGDLLPVEQAMLGVDDAPVNAEGDRDLRNRRRFERF